jgi:hypothetical protein
VAVNLRPCTTSGRKLTNVGAPSKIVPKLIKHRQPSQKPQRRIGCKLQRIPTAWDGEGMTLATLIEGFEVGLKSPWSDNQTMSRDMWQLSF